MKSSDLNNQALLDFFLMFTMITNIFFFFFDCLLNLPFHICWRYVQLLTYLMICVKNEKWRFHTFINICVESSGLFQYLLFVTIVHISSTDNVWLTPIYIEDKLRRPKIAKNYQKWASTKPLMLSLYNTAIDVNIKYGNGPDDSAHIFTKVWNLVPFTAFHT